MLSLLWPTQIETLKRISVSIPINDLIQVACTESFSLLARIFLFLTKVVELVSCRENLTLCRGKTLVVVRDTPSYFEICQFFEIKLKLE